MYMNIDVDHELIQAPLSPEGHDRRHVVPNVSHQSQRPARDGANLSRAAHFSAQYLQDSMPFKEGAATVHMVHGPMFMAHLAASQGYKLKSGEKAGFYLAFSAMLKLNLRELSDGLRHAVCNILWNIACTSKILGTMRHVSISSFDLFSAATLR